MEIICNKIKCSEIRETVLILNVAVARIEHAMIEGDDSFTSLSQSFIKMANLTKQISHVSDEINDPALKNDFEKNYEDISERVANSIVAFQFYDKLSQRMTLVSKTLSSLNSLLKDPDETNDQERWHELQKTIRSQYTLDSDQEMFDAVLSGTPIEEALKIAAKKTTKDEIEFF